MKKIMLIASLFLISNQLFAQDFEVPADYRLVDKEDYAPYEQDIINAVDWLLESPIHKERAKRKEVTAFLMMWMNGSPEVMIVISEEIVTFLDCVDCFTLFMGGWTKYAIESREYANMLKGTKAGIEIVIEFYKKNKDRIGKNKAIEKYIKLQDKGKLEAYIQSNLPPAPK